MQTSHARPVLLEVNDLHKSFDSPAGQITVLNGANLKLFTAEFLAIIGESGSGKSTLLHVLGTLEPADQGQTVLAGKSLYELSARQMATVRNHDIGFIYQAHHLIPELDAVENAMLPLLVRGERTQMARDKASGMLERLGLGHRLSHRPGRLSGGEAQRVAVARALVGEPKLLLADEPTGNLDEHTASEVFAAMRQLCKEEGASVVMVTHSLQFARESDRVLHLSNGKLVELPPEKF